MSIRYNTQALFVTPENVSGSLNTGDIIQISRVQSTSYQIELQRTNVKSLGLSYIVDDKPEPPYVSFDVEYLVTNGKNERNFGLTIDGLHGALHNISSAERDLFAVVKNDTVVAVGNCMLSKYTVNAAVNEFVKASVELKGFHIQVDAGLSGNLLPRVDAKGNETTYQYSLPEFSQDARVRSAGYIADNIYVAPHDIRIKFLNELALGTVLEGNGKSHLQNFSISVSIDRDEMTQLGDVYPIRRSVKLPAEVLLSTSFVMEKPIADNIKNYFCQNTYDLNIDIYDNNHRSIDEFWEEQFNTIRLKYLFRGLKLKGVRSSDSIDNKKSVTIDWSVDIGGLDDPQKNFFISGNYGRYLFPIESVVDISGGASSGSALRPVIREIKYKRVKGDIFQSDFDIDFSGNYNLRVNEPEYAVYYDGSNDVISGSGHFGNNIVKSYVEANFDAINYNYDDFNSKGYVKKFSTLYSKYVVGFPKWFERETGSFPFVIHGITTESEPIEISIANVPSWIDATVDTPVFEITPEKPYYFNKLNLGVNDFKFPSGYNFDICLLVGNKSLKKAYIINCETPEGYNVTLPSPLRRRTTLFLEPYNPHYSLFNEDGDVTSIQNRSIRGDYFSGVNGSSFAQFKLGENRYLSFDGTDFLTNTSFWPHDFRNFSVFALYRPTGLYSGEESLIRMYDASGVSGVSININDEFYIKKNGAMEAEMSYSTSSGVSGLQTYHHLPLSVPYSWRDNEWNTLSITYDGNILCGKAGTSGVKRQALEITNVANLNRVDLFSGFHGDVAEFILFPYKFNEVETANIEEYLKFKWGV